MFETWNFYTVNSFLRSIYVLSLTSILDFEDFSRGFLSLTHTTVISTSIEKLDEIKELHLESLDSYFCYILVNFKFNKMSEHFEY